MKICIVVVVMGTLMNGATAVTHTLMEFWTYSREVPNFPDFVSVGVFNGNIIYHYSSDTRRSEVKQECLIKLIKEEPQLLEWRTQRDQNQERVEKDNIETIRLRFNQTEGIHIWQRMSGCEWDDETDEMRGYHQSAFDGEDFISLDWDTLTWVAAKSQAFAMKLRFERNEVAFYVKDELATICANYLKKIVRLVETVVQRKELPLVSFLQKSSSSPVTCHATGFYPDRALLFWAKDGEELDEDPGEILPNNDGTFQSSVSLDLSSVPTEDWGKYSCVFQLSGVPDDLITVLDPNKILTNEKKLSVLMVAVLVSLAVVAVITGVVLYVKCKRNNVI